MSSAHAEDRLRLLRRGDLPAQLARDVRDAADDLGIRGLAELVIGVVAEADRDVPAPCDDRGGEGEEVPAEIHHRPLDPPALRQEVEMRLQATGRAGMAA